MDAFTGNVKKYVNIYIIYPYTPLKAAVSSKLYKIESKKVRMHSYDFTVTLH